MRGTETAVGNARSWVEIDEKRLKENYATVREAADAETDVLAVVKANAYGHELEQCAVALARAGARWLGVADAVEGVRARRALEAAGIGRSDAKRGGVEILVMCGVVPGEEGPLYEFGLTPVVWNAGQVLSLHGPDRRVHIEIETGMGRQGVRPGAELAELLRLIDLSGLEVDGVMTHFHSAEVAGSERTREQRRRFEEGVEQVVKFIGSIPTSQNRDVGHPIRWVHAGSSSIVDVGGDAAWLEGLARSVGARAMVRSGIALYGYALEPQGGGSRIRARLKPVMTWKTRVLDVREVQAGETIGYNATFTAKEPMRVALLPVGYADGLRRELSGADECAGGWVMVRGSDCEMQRANIVGRVSMNLTTVDVTGIDGVCVGDEVVLLGDGVTADDHARIAGTIAYEILCGVRG